MDARRLEMLLELSRLGSMREVAEVLHVTTSTVSQQLAALAREVGAELVEPEGRRVRLTPAGHRLAEHAVPVLAAIEAARVDLDPAATPAGVLRVASFATGIRDALLPVVRTLAAEHPDVTLQIHEHEPPEAFALLASDDVDLALTYDYNLAPATFDRTLEAVPLWTAEWALAVPSARACGRGTSLETFARHADDDLDRRVPQHRRPRGRAHAGLAGRLPATGHARGRQPRAGARPGRRRTRSRAAAGRGDHPGTA